MITTSKTIIPPYSSTLIDVRANGPGLNAFRATSSIAVIVEGVPRICDRLSIEVLPSINVLAHQDCQQRLKVHNLSSKSKVVAKGVKLASCSSDYELCDVDTFNVNLMTDSADPIDILCRKMEDLTPQQNKEARVFLEGYRDLFTVSSK